MSQKHTIQHGTFHVTTNTKYKIPWCTWPGVPEVLIDNLVMTRNIQKAKLFAFCIMPDHVHLVLKPGEEGLSKFMHSFKRNSSWHIRSILSVAGVHEPQLRSFEIDNIRWQNGFHDERIRDAQQRTNALRYVEYNAFHSGLISDPHSWPWSSLRYKYLLDPTDIWFDSPYDPR